MSKEVTTIEETSVITVGSLQSPEAFTKIADQVQSHVKQNKLAKNIKGKNYVEVEGWQFAGALIGLFPRLVSLEDLSNGNKYKYRAEMAIINIHTGQELGRAVAICTNSESSKRNFDEYAIASMAQTRAVGKAYRLLIGWIMKAAGFQPTPTEEMEEPIIENETSNNPKWYQVLDQFKAFAIKAVGSCETAAQIHELVETASYLKEDKDFIDTARAQYKALVDDIQ